MLTITPFLWFDTHAEDAMNLYTSIFPQSKVISVNRAGDRVAAVEFELEEQRFIGLNAGPNFTFNEAVSFLVSCETQDQIDELWEKLTGDGGETGRCGWLKDKFGLSWQIVPRSLGRLLSNGKPGAAKRVGEALFQMTKLDESELQQAFDAA